MKTKLKIIASCLILGAAFTIIVSPNALAAGGCKYKLNNGQPTVAAVGSQICVGPLMILGMISEVPADTAGTYYRCQPNGSFSNTGVPCKN
jgi:hypothetical protein